LHHFPHIQTSCLVVWFVDAELVNDAALVQEFSPLSFGIGT
jgi:hypothetical protein